jgi:single-strand DNA-binding protein
MTSKEKGILHVIGETQQLTDKFKKREFVIYVEGGYREKYVKFSLVQDDCSKIDMFSEGDTIEVSYELDGRRWNNPQTGEDQYFNDVKALHINLMEDQVPQDMSGEGDDLPF